MSRDASRVAAEGIATPALPVWLRHPGAVAGLGLLALVLLPALAAPVLPLADPAQTAPAQRMLPALSAGHLLGTDQLGRDLLSRLVWGARASIGVGVLATVIAALVGTVIGLAGAWLGRWADALLMRGVDVLMAFPYLLLALAIVAALGPGLGNAMLAIAVANVPFFARAVRGAALEIRHQDYIAAARLAGHGELAILAREVLPNLAPTLLLLMTTTLGWMVLETAGLSFLGLGAQPPAADLGSMLGAGREFLTTYPRVAVLPGLVIVVLVVGINLVGDGLRDLLDPRWVPRRPGAGLVATRAAGPVATRAAAPVATRAATPAAAPVATPVAHGRGGTGAACADDLPLLRVRGLEVRLPAPSGPVAAVDGVDLDLRRGERVALVGESGCGKTLTALSLLRLLPAGAVQRGSVRLDGTELMALAARDLQALRGRRLAYVPQEPLTALDPLFRVGFQIDETRRAHGADTALATPALLRLVGLSGVADLPRRFPHELSGGQRQRVALALALAHGPDLLIADEATTALDVTVQREILALLRRLCAEQGRALLFVSHDLAVVSTLCDRVLVMYAGRIVEDAPAAALLRRPAHPYTAALLGATPALGRPHKALSVLPGAPPMPGTQPSGCRFAPRCPRVQPVCHAGEPDLVPYAGRGEAYQGQDWDEGRRVRCRLPLEDEA
ncbi:dipeptide/oligopeptide/nickel ABC transporter permease/ATP-binding protein [uncultured Thiohalocapsa sp.]|uniref:dipeptide/oligopeptide/nickel ABC transporter permease/ATP-binding protein n=1 Tax=uncultured Thiohalocapsa sp. TaxID=768990 RepID=UPI0025E9EF27|nr:dipeptide/oligopeptide/nickel ABC transporter permease/ATP-binding protein [uncultured Thiohalocapsa sp.]